MFQHTGIESDPSVCYYLVLHLFNVGVQWAEMHRLAERVLLQELKAAGVLQGDVCESCSL